jgi:hypothetical protein
MVIIENLYGNDIVIINNEDGSIWSGLKSAYDEMTTQSTLPSESSIPTTPQAGE